jgi:ribosomal protein S18 acetylase RimI-like enzyme
MTTELQFRKATLADLPSLHLVIERAYRGQSAKQGWTHEADLLDDQRTDLATLSAIVASEDGCLLVAELNETIIGCVNLSRRPERGCYLGLLCIEPTLQAGGHGKQILAAAEHVAKADFDADHIVMTVIDTRTELIAYYERRGYHHTGETCDFPIVLDPPIFMVILRKSV